MKVQECRSAKGKTVHKMELNNKLLYGELIELRMKAMIRLEKSFYRILYYQDEMKYPERSIKLNREKTKYLEAKTALRGIDSTIEFLNKIENKQET